MPVEPSLPAEVREAQAVESYTFKGRKVPRVRYGDEGLGWGEVPCRDCGAPRGLFHVPDCEYEKCPVCGELNAAGHPCEFDELADEPSLERPLLIRDHPALDRLEIWLKRLVVLGLVVGAAAAVVWLKTQGVF